MRLNVLSVAYSLAVVGPDSIGGAEQILSRVDGALVRAGHRSLVIACEGSQVFGELISTGVLEDRLTEEVQRRAQTRVLNTIQTVLANYPVDLIHMHGLDLASYLPDTDLPIIGTLHLPPSWYPEEIFNPDSRLLLHCVSSVQRKACPAHARLLPDIPNGVPILYGPHQAKEHYALSLGRICPEKGFHLAIEASCSAGVPFVLAGAVFGYEAHTDYFEREIQPRLGAHTSFIGPVGGEQKRSLLERAKCLLVPSLVPETSCLVALEAMALGTPVIAFRAGALVDLIQDGENGFLVDDVAGMAAAVGRIEQISPDICRRVVTQKFSADRMTADYLEMYSNVISQTYEATKQKRERLTEGDLSI